MGIEQIDKNFKPSGVSSTDLIWANALDTKAKTYGVFYSEKDKAYMRFPLEDAGKIGLGYKVYADSTTGGRIRFRTNSPNVAFHVTARVADGVISSASALTNCYGVSVYDGKRFVGKFSAEAKDVLKGVGDQDFSFFAGADTAEQRIADFRDGKYPVKYSGEFNLEQKIGKKDFYDITLFLPLYNGVKEVLIGIKPNSEIFAPTEYKHNGYIAFYGSSVTHGGCASRPGLDYVSLLSQMLDCDVYNMGVTGSAKGGKDAEEYLAKLNPCIYFIDYDHNSPSPEHLTQTHYSIYEAIRKAHPNTPIVFASRIGAFYYNDYKERIDIINGTVEKAKKQGDSNVYFIDGSTVFPKEIEGDCTVDCCHPNDLGFYLMAKAFAPTLKEILEK